VRISGAGTSCYLAVAPRERSGRGGRGGILAGRLEDVTEDLRLRLSTHELDGIVNDDFGDRVHIVAFGQLGKLACLDDIRPHMWTFDREKRGQPGRVGAVGSGGGDKYLEMHVA
jgi:hypothetical protein